VIVCLRTVDVPGDVRDRYIAWIDTPERDGRTASDVHRAVDYHPITRYDVAGGYLNPLGLAADTPREERP
jgi:hypothetical protein